MPKNFAELVYNVLIPLLSTIIPFLFALTLLIIVWKIIDSWIINAGDTKKLDEGKKYAIWGVLVLVVMSAIWGIIRVLRMTLFAI